jgi:hypothetical protein
MCALRPMAYPTNELPVRRALPASPSPPFARIAREPRRVIVAYHGTAGPENGIGASISAPSVDVAASAHEHCAGSPAGRGQTTTAEDGRRASRKPAGERFRCRRRRTDLPRLRRGRTQKDGHNRERAYRLMPYRWPLAPKAIAAMVSKRISSPQLGLGSAPPTECLLNDPPNWSAGRAVPARQTLGARST